MGSTTVCKHTNDSDIQWAMNHWVLTIAWVNPRLKVRKWRTQKVSFLAVYSEGFMFSLYRSVTLSSFLSAIFPGIFLLNGQNVAAVFSFLTCRGTQNIRFYDLPQMNYRKLLASVSGFRHRAECLDIINYS